MLKKHVIFKILYIIVGILCSASLKPVDFLQSQSALIGQLAQHIVIGRTAQALVGNLKPLSLVVSFIFQNKCKDS